MRFKLTERRCVNRYVIEKKNTYLFYFLESFERKEICGILLFISEQRPTTNGLHCKYQRMSVES